MALERPQRVLICAARRHAKTTGAIRSDGSTHCLRRTTVRKVAMRNSAYNPDALNKAESALIKKGLVTRHSSGGTQCLIFKPSASVIPCTRVLRPKYKKPKYKKPKLPGWR